jgi:hypothetical protein
MVCFALSYAEIERPVRESRELDSARETEQSQTKKGKEPKLLPFLFSGYHRKKNHHSGHSPKTMNHTSNRPNLIV